MVDRNKAYISSELLLSVLDGRVVLLAFIESFERAYAFTDKVLFLEGFHDRRVELGEVGHQQHALLYVGHCRSRFLVAADHDKLEYLRDEWRDLLIDT